ncbi:hypothetical protein M758_UG325100 [Ceratodon purpureus]|nr:hypothetical protein M758_UG325100 [Ceratodon purpureus]
MRVQSSSHLHPPLSISLSLVLFFVDETIAQEAKVVVCIVCVALTVCLQRCVYPRVYHRALFLELLRSCHPP